MALNIDTINFVSFNIKGLKPRNYDYLIDLYRNYDILLLQETWLYKFEDSIVSEVLAGSCCCSVSAMCETEVGRQGRPYGGCMIIWKRSLTVPVYQINTLCNRVCAATINSDTINLLIINVYMPVDDGSLNSFNIFNDVINEINRLTQQYNDFKTIIGSDLNIDLTSDKHSRNKDIFVDFLNDYSLLSSDNIFNNVSYTYESYNGTKSILDYFIFSENCLNEISNFSCLYDGNNLSDHFPISFSLTNDKSINYLMEGEREEENFNSFDWKKASEEELSNYKYVLNELLKDTYLPDYIINCNNFLCKDHSCFIVENLNSIMDIINLSASLTIPKVNKIIKNKQRVGWNKYVRYHKDRSIFWNRVWIQAGRPDNGYLFVARKEARKKYHESIKFIMKNKDKIIRENVAEALTGKSFHLFWNELKKLRNNKSIRPAVIDDNVGDAKIANGFKSKYEDVYNEFKDFNNNKSLLDDINLTIAGKCSIDKCSGKHCITSDIMLKCVNKLKNYKHDFIYDLSSANLIFGSELLYECLATNFNCCLSHGISTLKINKSIIVPIPKNKSKSLNCSGNYRGISIGTLLCKIFEYVILELTPNLRNDNNNQFGFKDKHSTILCSYMLNQTVQYYNNSESSVYSLFLDASKAFDRIRYKKLYECLLSRKICPLVVRYLINMYILNNACVKFGNQLSEPFPISNGVKQGSILGPILFSIYLDPLIKQILDSGIGCYVGSMAANILAYADDIVILAPTLFSLKKLIFICERYGDEYGVNFNPDKSFLILFSNSITLDELNVQMNGKNIKVTQSGKHLGLNVSSGEQFYSFNEAIKDMKVKSNAISCNFKSLDSVSRAHVFRSQCYSLYGCQLWDVEGSKFSSVEICWRKCCRSVLGLSPRTHNALLPYLVGSESISLIIQQRILNFIITGLKHSNEMVNYFFKSALLNNFSSSLRNLNMILFKYKINYLDIFAGIKIKLHSTAINDDSLWKINILKELLHMRDHHLYDNLERSEILYAVDYICTK